MIPVVLISNGWSGMMPVVLISNGWSGMMPVVLISNGWSGNDASGSYKQQMVWG